MLKVSRMDLRRLSIMLLIYPLLVVTFKLFLYPLEMKATIYIILIVMFSLKVNESKDLYGYVLSLLIYVYIRSLLLIESLNISPYLSGYGNHIRNIMFFNNNKMFPIIKSLDMQIYIEKSLLYLLAISMILILHLIVEGKFIKRYFNIFNVCSILYLVFAWFNYIDVENQILIYLIGILVYSPRYEKLIHLLSTIFIMIMILNILNKVIPYDYINEKLEEVSPSILILRSDYKNRESFFDFESSIYYPDESRLGGSVIADSNKAIMTIVSAEDIIYLRGRVKDTYTGVNWKDSDNKFEKFHQLKKLGDKNFSGEKFKSAYISYTNLETLSIFLPIGVLDISLDKDKLMVDKDSSVYYKSSIFEENPKDYRIIYTETDQSIIDESRYLDLPETITERTKNLSLEISSDKEHDLEKVLALKDFLISNYPYSLDLSSDQNYIDFVDEFLFEEKKGYCTYFASSLAIMSRINNIASRYVEGYIVEASSYEDGKYIIREDKAHAWTEVYIDGSGWIIVDSTPIYDFNEDYVLDRSVQKEDIQIKAYEKLYENEFVLEKKNDEKILVKDFKMSSIYIAILLLLVLAATVLVLVIYINANLKLTNREKALRIIYEIDDILGVKIKINNNDTYTAYYKIKIYNDRIAQVFNGGGQFQSQKNAIIKDIEEILYAHKEVENEDLINLKKYLKMIKKEAFSNR